MSGFLSPATRPPIQDLLYKVLQIQWIARERRLHRKTLQRLDGARKNKRGGQWPQRQGCFRSSAPNLNSSFIVVDRKVKKCSEQGGCLLLETPRTSSQRQPSVGGSKRLSLFAIFINRNHATKSSPTSILSSIAWLDEPYIFLHPRRKIPELRARSQ
ncbi:hypothetical protein C8F04DRAFT_154489 [Mycena alexandri]|uniref:Uncharacterized protein n=1 Tax=Mycena alexandri TaxID=1745969 RepID=A0AAD6WXD2_9AGAR|nr:hypothetical protein C8F04DRAFT_154489 [Mycena alexandri]